MFLFCYLRPVADVNEDVSLLLFDSWFDKYRGVVCLVAVKSGTLKIGKNVWVLVLTCTLSILPRSFFSISINFWIDFNQSKLRWLLNKTLNAKIVYNLFTNILSFFIRWWRPIIFHKRILWCHWNWNHASRWKTSRYIVLLCFKFFAYIFVYVWKIINNLVVIGKLLINSWHFWLFQWVMYEKQNNYKIMRWRKSRTFWYYFS